MDTSQGNVDCRIEMSTWKMIIYRGLNFLCYSQISCYVSSVKSGINTQISNSCEFSIVGYFHQPYSLWVKLTFIFKVMTLIFKVMTQHRGYRKRPNKRPGCLLRCPVGEEGERAFIKAMYKLSWYTIDSMTRP